MQVTKLYGDCLRIMQYFWSIDKKLYFPEALYSVFTNTQLAAPVAGFQTGGGCYPYLFEKYK